MESDAGNDFERLAMPPFDSLYDFARWLAGDETGAEDLVQEAFTKALRGFSSFTHWHRLRACNTFLTSRTGSRSRLTQSLDEEEDEGETVAVTWETPESPAITSATCEALQYALERLPPGYREVVLLYDVEEMRYKDIAEVLAIPIGIVMSRIARARKLLRESFAGERRESSASAGKVN